MTVSAPETQHERWMKYGANVVFTTLVVILLAIMLTWIVQARGWRIDTTTGGTQSLTPQTVNFISDLKQPVHLVALYPKLKSGSHEQDYYQPVADLLNEYATKGKNVTTELIDPDTEKDAFNKLLADVTNKYGGEVKGYKTILDSLPDQNKKLSQFIRAEEQKFAGLPTSEVQDQNIQQQIAAIGATLLISDKQLKELESSVDSDLNQQIPSYKDGVDEARTAYTNVSQLLQQFALAVNSFKDPQAAKLLPKAIQDYGPEAAKRADSARKIADDFLETLTKLPPLTELDEFKQELKSKSIIIMADGGYKILQFDQVWKVPEESRFMSAATDVQPKLSFTGEQQITAAIASLTSGSKPMVVFVRNGGPPLTMSMSPEQPAPLLGAVAQRLRDDNFQVLEKDASGQSAMQQQEMPIPEATDEQMKKAVWVVFRQPQDSPPEQPSPLGPMLEAHLKEGGAAMVMLFPTADAMPQALGPMGITAKTDEVILHDILPAPARQTNDLPDSALQANQAVMKLTEYGNHPIGTPLDGLDFLQVACCPIQVGPDVPPGVKAAPLLPIPFSPHYWATTDAESLFREEHPKLVFNPKPNPDAGKMLGDIDNTPDNRLYAGAASEAPDGARLVVVGTYTFANSFLIDLQDQEMYQEHDLSVARLPGNGEFFVNSILWLAHMDNMLAISPHALQVARIKDVTPTTLEFWRIGVLGVGLPLLVIFAGVVVYERRRD